MTSLVNKSKWVFQGDLRGTTASTITNEAIGNRYATSLTNNTYAPAQLLVLVKVLLALNRVVFCIVNALAPSFDPSISHLPAELGLRKVKCFFKP